jgi:hypothetical protein
MTLHRVLERHRRNVAQRRNERAFARALSSATSPAEIRDLRSLASR